MKKFLFFDMKHSVIFSILFFLVAAGGYAQVNGPTPINVGTNQNYTFSNGTTYAEWFWSATGGTIVSQSLVGTEYRVTVNWTNVSTSNSIALYKVLYNISGIPRDVLVASKSIVVQMPVPNTTINQTNNCGNTVVTRTTSPSSSLYEWYWQISSDGTSLSLGKETSVTLTSAQDLYLRARMVASPNDWSTAQSLGAISITSGPALPSGLADEVIYGPGSISINVTPQGGDVVRWYATPTGGTHFYEGVSYTTPILTESTVYYVVTRNNTLNCETPVRSAITVTVAPLIIPSQVEVENVRIPGITSVSQIGSLSNTEKSKSITYVDGISRALQQVSVANSPNGHDVVQAVVYDNNGRVPKGYLPYVTNTSDGLFKTDYITAQPAFYAADNDKIANDSKPYSLTFFEDSPFGRVTEAGNVGEATWIGGNHTNRFQYSFNTAADNVRKFNADGSSTIFYPANKLYKTTVTDENNNLVISFTDDLGKPILKRVQLDEVINGATVNWLDTYTIYDDFGRVRYTISPKGVASMQAGNWDFNSIKDQYAYQNVYDKFGRLIEKKVPGQAWSYYVYDNIDRLIFMQDGLLRNTSQWTFIKYDQKNRAAMQGLYTNTVDITRAAVQVVIDNYSGGYTGFETRGTTLEGYTNTSFPQLNKDNSPLKILSVNYYDNHDFDNIGGNDYSYVPQGLTGATPQQSNIVEAAPGRTYGFPTGSKRLNLSTNAWLYTYVFYDKKGRVIQVRNDNHLSATKEDLTTNLYDFEGKIVKRKMYHKAGIGKETTVVNRYEYTIQGRLDKVYQNNNNAASDQLVVKYEYNELGQVVDKKLHGTGAAGSETFLQSVDFRYTIKGQLASINNSQLTSDGTLNDETTDYFGMELLYNTVEGGLNNTAYYNGNISAVKWKGVGAASGTAEQKSYKYNYDKSDKLKAASYLKKDIAWDKDVNAFSENQAYDNNGNIKNLQRYQKKNNVTELMDDLTYTYNSANGNSLQKVEDANASDQGFKNGSNTTDEYTYDINGNLTADLNKGITNIVYNFLGKPTQMTINGKIINYVYDATGSKLSMSVTQSGVTTVTDYVNGFVYQDGALSFFGSPEGRVVNNAGALEYQYSIADHQGNTRVVFSSATPAATASTATFETATNTDFQNYTNRSNFELMDHTDATTDGTDYSQKLTGGNNSQVGVTKSMKVYPGDKVKIEAYAKYYNAQSTNSNISGFALALTGAFGLTSASTGEALKAYNSLNNYGGIIASGGNSGNSGYPRLFVNILLFDKDFNFLDASWQQIDGGEQIGVSPKAAHDYMVQEVTVKEEGFAYVYVSNENPTLVEFYVDDVTITQTKSNVIQYNEYYPFGLQTANSWTRENTTGNNYLYNAANELNQSNGWYEMFYRGYDPALGRMLQIDPYAPSFASQTPYNYALNSPGVVNDPSGGNAYNGNVGMVGRQSTNLAYWNFETWWGRNVNAAWGTEGSNLFSDSGGGGGGRGGSYSMSAGAFVSSALNSQYGGSWSNGQGSYFTSDEEAFFAGVAYNNYHNSWGNTAYGSASASFVAFGIIKTSGRIPTKDDVQSILDPSRLNTYASLNGGSYPDPWYVGAWKSYWYNLADALGLNGINKVGIHISGDGSGMEQYAQKYMKLNGIEGDLDLSDPENIFGILNLMAANNELDAIAGFNIVYYWNPLNKSYKTDCCGPVPLWRESWQYPGFYSSWFDGMNSPYVYDLTKDRGWYKMVPVLKSSLTK